jgi:hypothetical protein
MWGNEVAIEYDNLIIHYSGILTIFTLKSNLYSNVAKVEWKEI